MSFKKIQYALLILSFVFVSSVSVSAQAEVALEQTYANSCEFVKSDFKTYIRPNDLKTRLDQVRVYEKIIGDQQLIYDRLKANNQYRDGMKLTVQKQRDNLNKFKLKFESYDDVLKKILAMSCQTDASSTLSLVVSARTLRAEAQSLLDAQKTLTAESLVTLKDVASKTEPRVSEK
jgi:hypothetical protein